MIKIEQKIIKQSSRRIEGKNMKNYNKDCPPIDCDCGCEETIKTNIEYIPRPDNWKIIKIEAEYNLCCKRCRKYLGHFAYGHWEY